MSVLIIPQLTTAERDALGVVPNGTEIFNTDDTVLQYTDDNGTTWKNVAYEAEIPVEDILFGEMYFTDNATETVISAANTPAKVGSAAYVSGLLQSYTHVAGTVTYVGSDTKVNSITAVGSFSIPLDQNSVTFHLYQNGVSIAKSAISMISDINSNELRSFSLSCLVSVSASDTFEVFVENNDADNNIVVSDFNYRIVSIGGFSAPTPPASLQTAWSNGAVIDQTGGPRTTVRSSADATFQIASDGDAKVIATGVKFKGKNDISTEIDGSSFTSIFQDTTPGTESALFSLNVYKSGVNAAVYQAAAVDGFSTTLGPGFYVGSEYPLYTLGKAGIGVSTGIGVDASSQFDVHVLANDKGSRPQPSLTTAQITAIASPATGLCAFDTDKDRLTIRKSGGYDDVAYLSDITAGSFPISQTFTIGGQSGISAINIVRQYQQKIGNMVHCVVEVDFTASSANPFFGLNVPFTPTFTDATQCTGSATISFQSTVTANDGSKVYDLRSQIGNSVGFDMWAVNATGQYKVNASFMYEIQ